MSQQPSAVPQPHQSIPVPAGVQRTFRMRWGLTIGLFVVFSLGGAGALVAWYSFWPSYTAEGIVEVEPVLNQFPALTGGYGGPEVPFQLYPSYVEAQVLAIRNYRVLDAALKELEGKQTLYGGGGAVLDLSQDVHVMYIPNTQNILVSLRGQRREEVTEIVKQILMQYTAQLTEDRVRMDADCQRDLRTERDDLRSQLTDIGRRLAALRDESSIIVTDERQSEQMSRVTALTQQLTVAQVQLAEARSAWDQFQKLRQQSEEGKDMTPVLMCFPDVMEALRRDPSIAAMKEQVSRLNLELAGMKQRPEEKNDDIRRLEAMLEAARKELQTRQNETLGQLFQQLAATLKNKYDRARDSEAELLSRLAEARTAALGAAKLMADYRAREDEFLRTQTLLNTVSEGLEKMRISSALARPNIHVTRWPMLPLEPSEPRLILYIPAVPAISVVPALGLGLVLSRIFRRRSPRGAGVTAEKSGS